VCSSSIVMDVIFATDEWSEELLVDFQELVGAHTGENMAHTVFEMMELFGLKGCVSSFALPLIMNVIVFFT
jgi:hypothetical protein